ncbi:DUF6343 family protein [Streptomyces sp. IBSBF 2435]|uniref:DUF6343 family protein n=1 Tax=Streptomyces sp. IBSBF 2435 TaxID=2903531 RepID=UPI002FDBA5A4
MRRTGYEPTQARSPLRLRLGLAVCGVVWGIGAAIGFALFAQPGWAALCAVIAAIAAADCVIVVRHMRQGARYQPGRDVPPYPPVDRRPKQRRH